MLVNKISDKGRINSLDLLRGIAVLLMVQQHTGYWFWDSGSSLGSLLSSHPFMVIMNGLGGLAAPLFILLAGTGAYLYLSKGNPGNRLFLRGLMIIIFGIILNIMTPAWFSPWSWYVLHLIGSGICISPLLLRLKTPLLLALAFVFTAASVVLLDMFNMPRYFSNEFMRGTFSAEGVLKLASFSGNFPVFPWIALFITGFISGRWISQEACSKILKTAAVFFSIAVLLFMIQQIDLESLNNGFGRRLLLINLYMYPAYPIQFLTLSAASLLSVYAVLIAGSRINITADNILVLTGRASLTLFIIHIVIIRNFMVKSELWQTFSEPVTIILQISVIGFMMILVFFWKRNNYRYGFEWLLRLI